MVRFFAILFTWLLFLPPILSQAFIEEARENQDREEKKEDKKKINSDANKSRESSDEIKKETKKKNAEILGQSIKFNSFILPLRQKYRQNDHLPFQPLPLPKNTSLVSNKEIDTKTAILKRMQWQVGFIAEGAHFDDADLRALNESNQTQISDSDDKISLAFSRFYLRFFFTLTHHLEFQVDIFKNGYWGNDQLAATSSNNSATSTSIGADPFQFGELFVRGYFIRKPNRNLFLTIGRQHYQIGGLAQDYILQDYLDAIVITYQDDSLGSLRLLAIDMFQAGGDPNQKINYIKYFSHDSERVQNLTGDVNILRHGLVYESLNLFDFKKFTKNKAGLQTRLYGYYARFGAVSGSGADRVTQGTTGNFADNDFLTIFGNRWLLRYQAIDLFFGFNLSRGINRKLPSANGNSLDITTNGYAINGGIIVETENVYFSFDTFFASGPEYNENGIEKNHGFVSFKGDHIGGFLLNRFWGVHPSAYTESNGYASFAYDYERASGTLSIHMGFEFRLTKSFLTSIDGWYLLDTGTSNITDTNATTSALRAQRRLGKTLGGEVNLGFDYIFNQYWRLYTKAGVFLPGPFYNSSDFATTDAPRGSKSFWGILVGSKLVF